MKLIIMKISYFIMEWKLKQLEYHYQIKILYKKKRNSYNKFINF